MPEYAIVRKDKIKSEKELNDRYKHNIRSLNVLHADPKKASLNENVVPLKYYNYADAVNKTLSELSAKGVSVRKPRSSFDEKQNSVLGLEVLLTFSASAQNRIDIEEWKRTCVNWLDKTFNPVDRQITFKNKHTGMEQSESVQNVKHVMYHGDESNPHIHAFIVPIDEKGRLNSSRYDGRQFMIDMQDSYAKEMAAFNLERGEKNVITTHQDISAYHKLIKNAVSTELPEAKENEHATEYRERANKIYQTMLSKHNEIIQKKDREIDIEKTKNIVEKQKKSKLEKQISEWRDVLKDESSDERFIQNVSNRIKKEKAFEDGLKEFPDKKRAEEIQNGYNQIIAWQKQRETEEKKKKETNKYVAK